MKPDVKREAARWVASLTSPEEGYRVVVNTPTFVSLHHRANGNRIRIYLRDYCAVLYKNGDLCKTYSSRPYDEPPLF